MLRGINSLPNFMQLISMVNCSDINQTNSTCILPQNTRCLDKSMMQSCTLCITFLMSSKTSHLDKMLLLEYYLEWLIIQLDLPFSNNGALTTLIRNIILILLRPWNYCSILRTLITNMKVASQHLLAQSPSIGTCLRNL